ncbi:alpha/beta hydrolase family protein [Microbulbifer sp. 2304DJ12-6]|uniref:alpha/beta hydrolase family protein n=1 Tax=Microbulbifer sp. 2304DJ12-6 TaxID=3233340 RepID=UPI0039B120B2
MKFRFPPIIFFFWAFYACSDTGEIEQSVVERNDGSKINYYMFESSHTLSGNTLLLILQGSDCNSVLQIESIFVDYKNIWPAADLLLIEKYGIDRELSYSSEVEREDCPIQYLQKDSPKQRVSDIKIVLDIVRKDDKYSNFIVLGGSEGAIIANLLAASIDYVDATISFNGGGRWFIDDIIHSIMSGYENSDDAKEGIAGFRKFSEHILNSKVFALEVSGHGYSWWHQMLSIDQLNVLQKVDSPLLVLQGGIDLSVSPQKVDELILALRKLGKENIEYLTYEGLDHGFNNIQGQSEREKVVNNINTWLKKTVVSPKKSM